MTAGVSVYINICVMCIFSVILILNLFIEAYPSSEIEQFTLLGSASMQYDNKSFLPGNQQILRITKAVPDQRGGAYHKHAIDIDDALKGLDIEFAFRITDENGSPAVNGADGFAFVIQAQGENALGDGGCEMGYGGIKTRYTIIVQLES